MCIIYYIYLCLGIWIHMNWSGPAPDSLNSRWPSANIRRTVHIQWNVEWSHNHRGFFLYLPFTRASQIPRSVESKNPWKRAKKTIVSDRLNFGRMMDRMGTCHYSFIAHHKSSSSCDDWKGNVPLVNFYSVLVIKCPTQMFWTPYVSNKQKVQIKDKVWF
jgi:hypothetical protein